MVKRVIGMKFSILDKQYQELKRKINTLQVSLATLDSSISDIESKINKEGYSKKVGITEKEKELYASLLEERAKEQEELSRLEQELAEVIHKMRLRLKLSR
jgi:predicted  nucleic acid-binding Zn-ribbon protein